MYKEPYFKLYNLRKSRMVIRYKKKVYLIITTFYPSLQDKLLWDKSGKIELLVSEDAFYLVSQVVITAFDLVL